MRWSFFSLLLMFVADNFPCFSPSCTPPGDFMLYLILAGVKTGGTHIAIPSHPKCPGPKVVCSSYQINDAVDNHLVKQMPHALQDGEGHGDLLLVTSTLPDAQVHRLGHLLNCSSGLGGTAA